MGLGLLPCPPAGAGLAGSGGRLREVFNTANFADFNIDPTAHRAALQNLRSVGGFRPVPLSGRVTDGCPTGFLLRPGNVLEPDPEHVA